MSVEELPDARNASLGDGRGRRSPLREAVLIAGDALILRLASLCASSWFAYTSILALQLTVMWGDWRYRDMPFGDTSYYFPSAYSWFSRWVVNPLWSPLYTMYWGTFLFFLPDAAEAAYPPRFLMIIAGTVLVLAVARRLLPSPIAWLLAAWWTQLHINYAILYEVHLFAFLPQLLALLVALSIRGRWGRGIAMGILVGSAVLTRNEQGFAVAVLGMACFWYELRVQQSAGGNRVLELRRAVSAYGIPIILGLLTIPFVMRHSALPDGYFASAARAKTTILMCMSYANVYQERYPGVWDKSPWLDCGELMQSRFGSAEMTYWEAFRQDPLDMIGHGLWNVGLFTSGIEYALFNGVAGSSNPDFVPVPLNQAAPRILGPLMLLVLGVGGFLLWRRWRYWWANWIEPRVWGWIILASTIIVAAIVTVAVKPRPEYLHGFWFFVMAVVSLAFAAIAERWIGLTRLAATIPLLAVLGFLFLPRYYDDPRHIRPRVILNEYQKLSRYADAINQPGTVLLLDVWPGDVLRYLSGRPGGTDQTRGIHWPALTGRQPGARLEDILAQNGVTVAHFDEQLLAALEADPGAQTFLTSPESVGWKLIGAQEGGGPRWRLYQRI